MTFWDWVVIGVYFLLIAGIAVHATYRQKTPKDFFLAGRNIGFFAIGGSLFASNIGSEHIVGVSGQGATSGMAMAHYELHAWVMLLLAWVFVPFYYRAGVYTMPEFLERRFNSRARWILSCVSLLAYVFTKVAVTVYAGALVFQTLLPDTFGTPENAFWVGAFATVILTGIYTIIGGLRAVLFTDTAQAFVLLVGSVALTFFGLRELGGWGELQAMASANADQFALWRPLDDPEFPWLGILIGTPIVGIWYWCTDQYIVQRTLAARDLGTARRGALWGGVLKLFPVILFLIPGMIGWALHQQGVLEIPTRLVGDETVVDGDQVFPTMVMTLLPAGLRGLVVGGLLAALMSSLSSLFNSTAALFTRDVYEKITPGRSDRHLVRVGRVATGVVVGLGILWIPVMPHVADLGLYHYLQNVQSYLAPPITAVFLLGLAWKRINAHGAVWGLSVGFVLGIAKLVIQALFGEGQTFEEPAFLAAFGDFNFLYYAGVLFAASIAVIIGVSLLTRAPDPAQIAGLTYGSRSEEQIQENRESRGMTDYVLTAIVLGGAVTAYLYFSFWLG
ncbi:MAG: sodium:solute symporter [Candidatus Hydrogenedentota bacterium]